MQDEVEQTCHHSLLPQLLLMLDKYNSHSIYLPTLPSRILCVSTMSSRQPMDR